MNRKVLAACIFIVLVGASISVWIIRTRQQRDGKADPSWQIYQITQRGKFPFPEVQTWTPINSRDLPQELNILITPDLTSLGISLLQMQSVRLKDGRTGYVIVATVGNAPASAVYSQQAETLTVKNDWKLVTGSHSEIFALLEVENDHFQVRLLYEPQTNGELKVTAQIVRK